MLWGCGGMGRCLIEWKDMDRAILLDWLRVFGFWAEGLYGIVEREWAGAGGWFVE